MTNGDVNIVIYRVAMGIGENAWRVLSRMSDRGRSIEKPHCLFTNYQSVSTQPQSPSKGPGIDTFIGQNPFSQDGKKKKNPS